MEHKVAVTEVLKMQRLHELKEAAKTGGLSFLCLLWLAWTYVTTQRWLF
jgi:hypothetical protein